VWSEADDSGVQQGGGASGDKDLGAVAGDALRGYEEVNRLIEGVGLLMDMHATLQVPAGRGRAGRRGRVVGQLAAPARLLCPSGSAPHARALTPAPLPLAPAQDVPRDWLEELAAAQTAAAADLSDGAAALEPAGPV
jgi:hypothetical protein